MKKKMICTVLSLTMLAGLTVQPVSAEAAKLGDVNTDGKVTVADVIMLSRYVAEDTTLTISDVGLANADADGDGIVTALDSTALLQDLAGFSSQLEMLSAFVFTIPTEYDPTAAMNHTRPTEISSIRMDVVTSKDELDAFIERGKQYAVYGGGMGSEQIFAESVVCLTTSIERSPDTVLTLDRIVRKDDRICVMATRSTPADAAEGPEDFQIHFRLSKEDYHGEPVYLYVTDTTPVTVDGVTYESESFIAGFTDEANAFSNVLQFTSASQFAAFTAKHSCNNPVIYEYDSAFFEENKLLVAAIAGTDSYNEKHTNSVICEDGLLTWNIDRVTSVYRHYGMTSYDLMVVAVPNDLNFTDVEFHTQSVTLIE